MPGAKKRFTACKDAAHATVEKFYEFKNATETSVDLYFYGDIVSDWWGAWQEEDQYPGSYHPRARKVLFRSRPGHGIHHPLGTGLSDWPGYHPRGYRRKGMSEKM